MRLWRRKRKPVTYSSAWERDKKLFPSSWAHYDGAIHWKHCPPGIQTAEEYGFEMAGRAVIAKERHRRMPSEHFAQLLASARREFLDYLDRDVHP